MRWPPGWPLGMGPALTVGADAVATSAVAGGCGGDATADGGDDDADSSAGNP
eukprot:CAMPEP_0175957898 /NCGR_PEP_ID=MMETSP0108-20121206/33948_1 /TAXON_ID=195067 ORGANISM="Goniomonas pacifica, Strain CCMP1869" /NCGR_SAMPLE_ID=MMETSP0108 /ASSEMBLY_ACC=CAM_ASM_000204 /LENGTH=51 /DNA_ID=CAMNT_0017285193 /DNA_START=190 /DNA_END=341 /DNA_ORIENTATION=+